MFFKIKPEIISLSDVERINFLKEDSVRFIDEIDLQIEELCEIHNPFLRDKQDDLIIKKQESKQIYREKSVFCYFSWRNLCVRVLFQDLYNEIFTARNLNLINNNHSKEGFSIKH